MKLLFRIFSKNYFLIIFLIFFYVIFESSIPDFYKNFLYSFSLFIKSLLSFVIPFVVFSYISYTICFFEKKVGIFLLFLFVFEFFSNFSTVFFTYFFSTKLFSSKEIFLNKSLDKIDSLLQIFSLPVKKPSWLTCDKALILGIVFGFLKKKKISIKMKNISEKVMSKFFLRLIPFFVLGLFANMYKQKIIQLVFSNYLILTLKLICIIYSYIFLIYFIASGFSIKKTIFFFKNMIPSWMMGFTTGCSLSTMPLTIKCTSKNSKNPDFVNSIIPATTNIQQIGDCIMMSFVGLVLYFQFFGKYPDFFVWSKFAILFTLGRFTVTAVVGGTVFLLMPIFESYLNFSPEMVSIFLMLNMIFDPIVTASNILGNGGLCLLFEKLLKKFNLI
jgi:Na+/H+-dicarboxylate symporter